MFGGASRQEVATNLSPVGSPTKWTQHGQAGASLSLMPGKIQDHCWREAFVAWLERVWRRGKERGGRRVMKEGEVWARW